MSATDDFSRGVSDARASKDPAYNEQECKDVRTWTKRIEEARKYDEEALKQYIRDRKYARGDAGNFEVSVPIATSIIEVLLSFLYARDPDLDIVPAPSTQPPVGVQINDAISKRKSDADQLAQTLEIVIGRLWLQAQIKAAAKACATSALTVGVGWLKITWQERQGNDPLREAETSDLTERLAELTELQRQLTAGEGDPEMLRAQIEQRINGLQGPAREIIARGLAVDFVRAQDMIVSPEAPSIARAADSPWLAEQVFMPLDDAKATFPKIAEQIGKASTWYPRALPDKDDLGVGPSAEDVDASDVYTHTKTQGDTNQPKNVRVFEIWDKEGGNVLTLVEGVDQYARAPYQPDPQTLRFYAHFPFCIGVVDDERHPVSLMKRCAKLFDEYHRVRSAYAEHRRRTIPKTVFDKRGLKPSDADAITKGGIQELVGIEPPNMAPGESLQNALVVLKYAPVDAALYDTSVIRAEIEQICGLQEAVRSTVQVAKTATEAEIQQTGTQSRLGHMRDTQDDMLSEAAKYTAEVALAKISQDDAKEIAGPWAFWPTDLPIDALHSLVNVRIKAGSTGKPNTAQKQQVWAQAFPIIKQSIVEIGNLRKSTPQQIADCMEQLVRESLERTGERIDAERFLPDDPPEPPAPPPPAEPQKLADSALSGQQVAAMTTVCDQVRTGVLSPMSALAVLKASFPTVPEPLLAAMVGGVAQAVPPPELTAGAPIADAIHAGAPEVAAAPAQPTNGGTPPNGETLQ